MLKLRRLVKFLTFKSSGKRRKIFVFNTNNWSPAHINNPCLYSHNGLHHPRMTTHAQVVIAAPDGHLPLLLQGACEVVGHGELVGQAVDGFKHAVGVVALLLDDLLLQELVVAEARHCGRGRRACSRVAATLSPFETQRRLWSNGSRHKKRFHKVHRLRSLLAGKLSFSRWETLLGR